jgi:hypothetical protein
MSAAVAWTHQIVEGSADPLAIPQRPVPAAPVVELHEMPGRLWTFRVISSAVTIGFVRHSPDDLWIARDCGSDTNASTVRRFASRTAALAWLRGRH